MLINFGASHDVSVRAHEQRIVGTPAYLAPEVLNGQPQSRASDIYAIGVLLYHLVTGAYPIDGRTWTDVIGKHERGESVRQAGMKVRAPSPPRCRTSSSRQRDTYPPADPRK